jgi:hypothetical protein
MEILTPTGDNAGSAFPGDWFGNCSSIWGSWTMFKTGPSRDWYATNPAFAPVILEKREDIKQGRKFPSSENRTSARANERWGGPKR